MSAGKHLDPWYVLLIAEAISGKRAEQLAAALHIAGVELPLDASLDDSAQISLDAAKVERGVLLCARIICNLPISKKERVQVGCACVRLLLGVSGRSRPQQRRLEKEIERAVEAFAAGAIGVAKLGAWIHSWVGHGKRPGNDAKA